MVKAKSANLLIYIKKLSVNAYDYLLFYLGPKTLPELQLHTDIIDETPYQIVYQW